MIVQCTVEVRITQQGMYGQSFNLGENYTLELNTLSDAAQILVRLHELCEQLLKQDRKQK